MTSAAIGVSGLIHRYGEVAALDRIDLAVQPGEIFGILGPNGGGKTTLFRILATMLRPTAGTASIFGHDVATDPAGVRQRIGVVFQSPSLDGKLTAKENLVHQGRLHGLGGAALRDAVSGWLTRVNLTDRANDRVEKFSGGMRRRVELAKALLHNPALLLADEPATGLDPGARRDIWGHFRALRDEQKVTIALTTHLMDEAERCDRLAIIHRGKIVAVDTPAALKRAIRGDVISIRASREVESLRQRIAETFGPWPEGGEPTIVGDEIHMEKPDGPAIVAKLGEALAGDIDSITVGRPTLEDVFLHLTGQSLSEDEAPAGPRTR